MNPTLSSSNDPLHSLKNIWLTVNYPQDIITLMTWHPGHSTDTCKSDAMWRSLFVLPLDTPSPEIEPEPEPETEPEERVSGTSHAPITHTMEEDLRRDLQPPFSSDPRPLLGACTIELTRTNSDSSAVTVDNASKDLSHHYAASPFPDQSTRWTDQQHSLYLNSLEASFVNELHRSMRLRDWSLQNNTEEAYESRTLKHLRNMPRQFLALQDGCWKKISLERIDPLLESTADSNVLAGSQLGLKPIERGCTMREPNTYDHGLLCDEGIHARGSSTFSSRSPRSSEKQCICCSFHLESVGNTAEVTDQNFKDEVARSSCVPMPKRLKTAAADASSNDHVVPFGKLYKTDVSTSTNSTSENKGRELLSELPKSFHFPKSDLSYFLRGS